MKVRDSLITVNKRPERVANRKKNKREVQATSQYVHKKDVPQVDITPLRADPLPSQKVTKTETVRLPGLNEAENNYAKGLMNPWVGVDLKIPNVFPVPTKTLTWRGVLNFKSDPQGFARAIIRPYNIANTICTSVGTAAGGPDSDEQLNADINFDFLSMCDVWMAKLADGSRSSAGLQVQRFRVVSAATKVTNVTSAVNRSGFITGVHTLQRPEELTPQEARALPQSRTANSDEICEIPWVPHDPNCYNFYPYNVKKEGSVYTEIFPMVETYGVAAPDDVRSNCIYYGISGAPSQQFALDYVINIEYVPGTEYVALLNPVADTRGDPNKAILALAQANPKQNSWDDLLAIGGDLAKRALLGLGNLAIKALI